jgi:hypothetical protein
MAGFFKTIRGWLPRPPSTNYAFRKFDVSPYDLLPPNPVIYDIGAQEARAAATRSARRRRVRS